MNKCGHHWHLKSDEVAELLPWERWLGADVVVRTVSHECCHCGAMRWRTFHQAREGARVVFVRPCSASKLEAV